MPDSHGVPSGPSRRTFLRSSATGVGALLCADLRAEPGREESGGEETFDYIVVGAGSSGCVLANRLTEDPDVRVLLLEAGGPDSKPEIHAPAQFRALWGSEVDWSYATEPEPHLDGRSIPWPRGKVLGGSSSISAMTYIRGHRLDYDHWNYLGNPGWDYEAVLPYFKRSEANTRGASHYHGGEGLLSVTDHPDPSPPALAFLEAAAESGYESDPRWDFNGPRQEGVAGLYQSTIKGGRRHSAAAAFLTPFLDRANLVARPWSLATRLLWGPGDRVVGVEYVRDGRPHEARAGREVIISAGSIDSPQLLMLSGIGPADHLRSRGITPRVDLPGVGQNLQDHPRVPVVYHRKQDADPQYAGADAGLFLRSRPALEASSPDLQFNVLFGVALPKIAYRERPWFDFSPTLTRPQSAGAITLRSDDPLAPPVIRANYLESAADAEVLIAGVTIAQDLAHTRALRDWLGDSLSPAAGARTDAERLAAIRRSAASIYHPVGTCKMGRDRMAVVDPELRVHGVRGLRVADASIMPTLVNGNTNAACIMIGEKAADLIRKS